MINTNGSDRTSSRHCRIRTSRIGRSQCLNLGITNGGRTTAGNWLPFLRVRDCKANANAGLQQSEARVRYGRHLHFAIKGSAPAPAQAYFSLLRPHLRTGLSSTAS